MYYFQSEIIKTNLKGISDLRIKVVLKNIFKIKNIKCNVGFPLHFFDFYVNAKTNHSLASCN